MRKRLFLIRIMVIFAAGIVAYVYSIVASWPWNGLIALAIWGYVVYGWWCMHPRKCVVCGERKTTPIPMREWPSRWWDPRYIHPWDIEWACPEHFRAVLLMQAVQQFVRERPPDIVQQKPRDDG